MESTSSEEWLFSSDGSNARRSECRFSVGMCLSHSTMSSRSATWHLSCPARWLKIVLICARDEGIVHDLFSCSTQKPPWPSIEPVAKNTVAGIPNFLSHGYAVAYVSLHPSSKVSRHQGFDLSVSFVSPVKNVSSETT